MLIMNIAAPKTSATPSGTKVASPVFIVWVGIRGYDHAPMYQSPVSTIISPPKLMICWRAQPLSRHRPLVSLDCRGLHMTSPVAGELDSTELAFLALGDVR